MKYKVNPESTIGGWYAVKRRRNKKYLREMVDLISKTGLVWPDRERGFTVYSICRQYRIAHGTFPVESTVRGLLRKLTAEGLLIKIKE